MTLPVRAQTEKWGNICTPLVGYSDSKKNVTKSSPMTMRKVVQKKTKYSKIFITKLEQGNAGPGE